MPAPKDWKAPTLPESGVIPVGALKGYTVDEAIQENPHKLKGLMEHGWIKLTRSAELSLDSELQDRDDDDGLQGNEHW